MDRGAHPRQDPSGSLGVSKMAASVVTQARRRVVGHGELLKAVNALLGCTDQRFRIATMYLAYATPPRLAVFVKTTTIATLVGCTKRRVKLCRRWLEEHSTIEVTRGGGRGRSTVVDFEPLAERLNSERSFAVSVQTANED